MSHPLQLPPFHEGRTQPPTCARSAAGENIRRWSTHVEQGLHRDELGPRELPGAQRASDLVVPRLGVAKPSPGCLGLNLYDAVSTNGLPWGCQTVARLPGAEPPG